MARTSSAFLIIIHTDELTNELGQRESDKVQTSEANARTSNRATMLNLEDTQAKSEERVRPLPAALLQPTGTAVGMIDSCGLGSAGI